MKKNLKIVLLCLIIASALSLLSTILLFKNTDSKLSNTTYYKDILSLAFINKDDYIITTSPVENNITNMGKWLEGKVYEYKINKFNRYLIDLKI